MNKIIRIVSISLLLFLLMAQGIMAQDGPMKELKKTPKTIQKEKKQRPPREKVPVVEQNQPNPKDTTEFIIMDNSNEIEGFKEDEEEVRFLKGDVVFHQDDVYFYCDSAYMYEDRNEIFAWGNVTILQPDSVNVFSDTLRYFGDEKLAWLDGNVVMIDSTQELYTERLDYNLETEVAEYEEWAILKNGDTQLTSRVGIYETATKEAFFKDSVLVVSEKMTLRADSLNYNTETQFSDFIGPTLIIQDSAKIYCEEGYYDNLNEFAEFTQSPQYVKGDRIAVSDKMIYDGALKQITLEGNAKFKENDKDARADVIKYLEEEDITRLEGNAKYKDTEQNISSDVIIYDGKDESFQTQGKTIAKSKGSYVEADNSSYNKLTNETTLTGNVYIADTTQILTADWVRNNSETGDARAIGNVIWRDTVNQVEIESDTLDFNQQTEYVKAIGRPVLKSLMYGDTLYLSSDTLISKKELPDSIRRDTVQKLFAISNVLIYKNDFQAACDSMVYNTTDSLFSFYNNPVIWSDSTQFSADTTIITLKSEKIDSVYLLNKAFIVDTPDEQFFNQIKGRNITVKFKEENPQNMRVDGNGESVYYALDDDDAYVGVNKTICSRMFMRFNEGDLDKIHFYVQPKSVLHPMKEVDHQTMLLNGFKWQKTRRPMSPADLKNVSLFTNNLIIENEEIPEEEVNNNPLEPRANTGNDKAGVKLGKGDVKRGNKSKGKGKGK